jgi:hypothetical protein
MLPICRRASPDYLEEYAASPALVPSFCACIISFSTFYATEQTGLTYSSASTRFNRNAVDFRGFLGFD